MEHSLPIRVYYEDTDAGGVVYHANFLKFAERGRTEFLRHIGFENNSLKKDKGIIFVVRHMTIDYLKPAFLDDSLTLKTTIQTLKNTSFTMRQTVYREKSSENGGFVAEMICDMLAALVCVDTMDIRPVRLPEPVKEAFLGFVRD